MDKFDQERNEDDVNDLRNERDAEKLRADKAEAACAEMRNALERFFKKVDSEQVRSVDTYACAERALSSDCGKSLKRKMWLCRRMLKELRDAYLQDACNGCYPLPYPADSNEKRQLLLKADLTLEDSQ